MSSSLSSVSGQGGGGEGATADLPDPPNTDIEEAPGKGKCIVRFHYEAEKGDNVNLTLEDEGGDFFILFTVRRINNEKVVCRKRSKLIPGKHKGNLVLKDKNLNLRKKHYIAEFEKKADFKLDIYFRPESP